jgi:tetratricopeptide (TPR) repeat protein
MRLLRGHLLILGFVGAAIAVPAQAQQPPSNYPPPCDGTQVSKSDVDRAHAVFLSGKQFLEESNYDKALGYFQDAYTIDCSVHAILPIIATAYERKGDKAEAIRALEEYLKRVPNASDREVVERRIKNLREQLPREPSAAAGAASAPAPSVEPSAAPPTPGPAASAPAFSPTKFPAPSPTPPPQSGLEVRHSGWPWVAVGLGGAAVLVAAPILFAVGNSDVSSAQLKCGGSRVCPSTAPPDAIGEGNGGRALETSAFVVGGAGLALTGVGLLWHFLERTDAPATSAHVGAVILPHYAGVGASSPF